MTRVWHVVRRESFHVNVSFCVCVCANQGGELFDVEYYSDTPRSLQLEVGQSLKIFLQSIYLPACNVLCTVPGTVYRHPTMK